MSLTDSVELVLGNSRGEQEKLFFRARPTAVAQRWLKSLAQANNQSSLRETDRFYNFPNQQNSSDEYVADQINKCLDELDKHHPGLIPWRCDLANLQDSVNKIHTFFADTHLVVERLTRENEKTWTELNAWLHALESIERSRKTEQLAGIPEANIVVTWTDAFKTPLEDEDYRHFTVAKKFGTCYLSYCQVGRHFYELFLAQDELAADEHVLPLRSSSAESYIWLGSTTGPRSLEAREQALKTWFEKNSARFNALGHHWGDPKLAIGWLPVADLAPEIKDLKDQVALVNRLASFDRVVSFRPVKI